MKLTNQHILTECIAIHGQVHELFTNSGALLAALKAHSTEMAQRDITKRQDLLTTLAAESPSPKSGFDP